MIVHNTEAHGASVHLRCATDPADFVAAKQRMDDQMTKAKEDEDDEFDERHGHGRQQLRRRTSSAATERWRQHGGKLGGLAREHRQNLALETTIAERHAAEMFDIDRTIIGSERRRG